MSPLLRNFLIGVVSGALAFCTAAVTALTAEGVSTVADVSQAQWLAAAAGGVITAGTGWLAALKAGGQQ